MFSTPSPLRPHAAGFIEFYILRGFHAHPYYIYIYLVFSKNDQQGHAAAEKSLS